MRRKTRKPKPCGYITIYRVGSDERPASEADIKDVQKQLRKAYKAAKKGKRKGGGKRHKSHK